MKYEQPNPLNHIGLGRLSPISIGRFPHLSGKRLFYAPVSVFLCCTISAFTTFTFSPMKYLLLFCLLLAGAALRAQTPTVPAPQQTDQIILDNNSNSKADPGDRIRYKVTVQNTGTGNATGTKLNAVPDSRTTLDAASFRSSPVATNDGTYACTGNVGISVPAASGVKANDFDDNLAGATLTVGTGPANGVVTLNNDGSFTYTPNAGYTGSDQFTYVITDVTPVMGYTPPASDITGTVSITVSNMLWFVDNTGGGTGGAGTLSNPFKTLTNFNGSAGPQVGQVVFVKNTGTGYHGGIVLKNSMSLFGSGHSGGSNLADAGVLPFAMAANSLALPAIGGTRPILWNITVGVGYGITLASGNTIRGVEVGRCLEAKIFGNAFGTLTIGNSTNPDVALSGNKFALDLNNGVFAATSKFASINSPDSSRILLNTVSGTLASASTTVAALGSGGGITIDIQNSSAALDLGNTTVNNFNGGTCISITNSATGSVTFSNLSMPYLGNGVGLLANNGGTINIGGTASAITARHALDITNTSFGSGATFASITSTNSVTKAVNLDNVTGSVVINGGSISTTISTGVAFDVNAGSSTITYAGTISYSGMSAGRTVEVTGRTGGTVTLSGNISTSVGTGINVASNTGGTITFSGTSKSLSTGVNAAVTLATNTGATVNFTGGGLAITTTTAMGFSATGGGTVNVTGASNTISSTTGTALNVASTTIGASGLTFQSISANGGPNGIVLNGSSGNLTVTGDGSGHANGSGGSLANITGGVLGNAPVHCLTASGTITLKSMNMSLNTNCYSGMLVDNNAGGNITVNITGCTFIGVTTSIVQNKSLLQFEAGNTGGSAANVTANVQNSFFYSNRTYGMFATAAGDAIMNVTLNQSGFGTNLNTGAPVNNPGYPGGTITNPPPFSVGITNSSNAKVDYNVTNNTFWGADASLGALYAVTISGATTSATSHLQGFFTNNKIGQAGTASSGCNGNCAGLGLLPGTNGTFNASVSSNDIRQVGAQGINFFNSVSGAAGTAIAHITNNTLAEPVTGFTIFLRAIVVSSGNSGGSTANWCSEVTGNNISGTWQAGNFIRITTNNTTGILTIPGLTPTSGATAAQVNAYIQGLNTLPASNINTTVSGAINGGSPCPTF